MPWCRWLVVCVVLCQESVRGPRGLEGGGGLQGTGGGQGMGKYAFNSNFTLLPGRGESMDGERPPGVLHERIIVLPSTTPSVLRFRGVDPDDAVLCCAVGPGMGRRSG